jgi:uncharacterized membrane-anchored protein
LRPPAAASSQRTDASPGDAAGVRDAVSRIERLVSADERDSFYFDLAVLLVGKGEYEDARTVSLKISNDGVRRRVMGLVSFNAALQAADKGEVERIRLVADKELAGSLRAFIYYKVCAGWLERGDWGRALETLSSAMAAVAKEDDLAERARLYLLLASAFARADAARGCY